MYLDPATARPKRGVAGNGRGAALRFGKVVRQLDLTFDPEVMSADEFIAILPKEFAKWKDAYFAGKKGYSDSSLSQLVGG